MFKRDKRQSGSLEPVPSLGELLRRWHREEPHNRIAVNGKDGTIMVHIPEGEFEMGDGKGGDCPKHRVYLSAYWIGVYSVTNAQYLKFVEATGRRAPDNRIHRESGKASHPVTDVSWDDALAYAKWAGGQLPTEAQWEKAARGPKGLIYPWGDAWDAGKYRHDGNKGNETTCAVQGYPQGVSGYGTYNQGGNVVEWCADWYDSGYYGQSPGRDPGGPGGGSCRVLRGGSWRGGVPVIFRGAYRFWRGPGNRYGYLGFRLVRTRSGPLPS
jgi:formylglycine-generating enzyme required for sulfatase activity